MTTAIIVILLLLCAVLINAIAALERSLRGAAKQIDRHLDGETVTRLELSIPNAAAEELFHGVDRLLEQRQREGAESRRREEDLRRQIADVSHDLRTPLTSILGYLQLLEDDTLSPEDRAEYLRVVGGRAETLQTLITSFYDLSRAEGGQWQLEREPVDLARVLGDQLAAAYDQLEGAGMAVTAELPDGLPPVWGDKNAVVRVASNLLTNALRHGVGEFSVRLCREGEYVVSTFSNGAPGMTAEDAARAFERFYTGDRSRNGQDTGLGLAIVQALCRRMGCQASAALEDGRFTVRLAWMAVR